MEVLLVVLGGIVGWGVYRVVHALLDMFFWHR